MKLQTIFLHTVMISFVASLSGCGYTLRGYSSSQQSSFSNVINNQLSSKPIILEINGGEFSNDVKKSLINESTKLNIVVNGKPNQKHATQLVTDKHNHVVISNVQLRQYELAGVLTEVRMVLSADVTYYIGDSKAVTTHQHNLLVEDSYQHNKASVSFADSQSRQVTESLYQELSKRVAEQYITLQ